MSPKRALTHYKITESKMPRTSWQDTCRERTPRHGDGEVFGKQYGDGAFHPGEARDERLPVQPGLTNYQAVMDVITYIDGTTDASVNNAGLERIVVQDASYMVIVPNLVKDTPPLPRTPVFLYYSDRFTRPQPFRPDNSLESFTV
jgi:hypothetical protein